ncbi:hypothetical protein ABT47_03285 [Shewanella xiamenensis]|nr:hypothetical protein ABT47_03285 [Shewanella xiamenensis]
MDERLEANVGSSTKGGYYKVRSEAVVDEPQKLLKTCIAGERYEWTFSKSDILRTGESKNEFLRYRLK